MNQDNIELLITRSLDGTITPEEFERLETILNTDESARETLVLMAVQDVQIGRLFREQLGMDLTTASGVPSGQRSGNRVLRFAIPLAAAAMLLVVGGLWFRGRPEALGTPLTARVHKVRGAAWSTDTTDGAAKWPLEVGSVLARGQEIHTGPDGFVRVETADGTVAELLKDGRYVWVSDKEVKLGVGSVLASVTQHDPKNPFTVESNEARARVLGTEFGMTAHRQWTQLVVSKGLVEFIRLSDSKPIQVPAGHHALAFSGVEFVPRPQYYPAHMNVDHFRDGALLFSDDFETDLSNWQRGMLSLLADGDVRLEKSSKEEAVNRIRLEKATIRGKRSEVLVCDALGLTNRIAMATMVAPLPGGARAVEFDVQLGPKSGANYIMHSGRRSPKLLYRNPKLDDTLTDISSRRKWYRNRFEYIPRASKAGKPTVELKNFVNGKLAIHQILYTEKVIFGCTVSRGQVMLDNFTVRELIPKRE